MEYVFTYHPGLQNCTKYLLYPSVPHMQIRIPEFATIVFFARGADQTACARPATYRKHRTGIVGDILQLQYPARVVYKNHGRWG